MGIKGTMNKLVHSVFKKNSKEEKALELEQNQILTIDYEKNNEEGDECKIETICAYENNETVWVCSFCETENLVSEKNCCVCYHAR